MILIHLLNECRNIPFMETVSYQSPRASFRSLHIHHLACAYLLQAPVHCSFAHSLLSFLCPFSLLYPPQLNNRGQSYFLNSDHFRSCGCPLAVMHRITTFQSPMNRIYNGGKNFWKCLDKLIVVENYLPEQIFNMDEIDAWKDFHPQGGQVNARFQGYV